MLSYNHKQYHASYPRNIPLSPAFYELDEVSSAFEAGASTIASPGLTSNFLSSPRTTALSSAITLHPEMQKETEYLHLSYKTQLVTIAIGSATIANVTFFATLL
jgi:hypothetical protein